MSDQFLDVPDEIELRQVGGKLLVGQAPDGTLIPVVVDGGGVLILVSGPGNDYTHMVQVYRAVPDRIDLKQVGGSLIVGKNNGTLLPVAVDSNGRIIASGGGGGGSVWRYWEPAHADDNAPVDPTIAVERRFLNGDSPVVWLPPSGPWV